MLIQTNSSSLSGTSHQFGKAIDMTPLERLRYEKLTVRFNQETGKLMVGPKHLLARWSDFIVEHRDQIIADLDEKKKADALAKLPPVEFDQGEVVMREAVLLKLPDGSYLAATPEEVRKLDMRAGSARAKRAAGESSAKQQQQQSAGLFSFRPKRKTSSTISPSS